MEHMNVLYLSQEDIREIGGDCSHLYVEAVRQALIAHARGEFVQPLKPYLRVEPEGHIADRIIAMPAHIGSPGMSGIKWVGSKHDNPDKRGLERASALIILNDPQTHYPIAVMEGSLVSGMRTAAVTVLAARYLAREGFEQVGIIGCGVIARMHAFSLLEQFPAIRRIFLHDQNVEAAYRLALLLRKRYPKLGVTVTDTPGTTVEQAEVLVPCTVTDQPYIPLEWIPKGAFVSNISIMDLHKEVFTGVDKVVVDDWDQSNRERKVIHQLVLEGRFSRNHLHGELGEIIIGTKPGREKEDERIVLNPMGMAIEDIACAEAIYRRALEQQGGRLLPLYASTRASEVGQV